MKYSICNIKEIQFPTVTFIISQIVITLKMYWIQHLQFTATFSNSRRTFINDSFYKTEMLTNNKTKMRSILTRVLISILREPEPQCILKLKGRLVNCTVGTSIFRCFKKYLCKCLKYILKQLFWGEFAWKLLYTNQKKRQRFLILCFVDFYGNELRCTNITHQLETGKLAEFFSWNFNTLSVQFRSQRGIKAAQTFWNVFTNTNNIFELFLQVPRKGCACNLWYLSAC